MTDSPKHTFDIYAIAEEYRRRDPDTLTHMEKTIIHVADATLMDDIFMSEVFHEDKEGVAYLLNIILERDDLTVKSVSTQHDITSAFRRSIHLDIRAVDTEGQVYDIEIQRSRDGAIPRRARFYSSKLDGDLLDKEENFRNLVDTYVIFITETDIWGYGLPIYKVERHFLNNQYIDFGDGTHIYYVNGAYRADDPIGRLMHDFHCNKAEHMYSSLLADRLSVVKGNEERSIHMGWNSQDIYEEGLQIGETRGEARGKALGASDKERQILFSMFRRNQFTNELISDMTSIPLETVNKFAQEYQNL